MAKMATNFCHVKIPLITVHSTLQGDSGGTYIVARFSKLCVLWLTGYIGEFEIVDDHRAGKIVVFLNGRLNKCGVISPRFDVALNDIEKWASNLLPSRQFGYVQVGVHEAGKRVDLIPMFPPSWKRNGNWIHLSCL